MGQPIAADAILFTGAHRLAARPLPLSALGRWDLLIRTACTAISPAEAWPRLTGARADLPGEGFPLVPGEAAVGTVVAAGAAVEPAWFGARVFVGTARTPVGTTAAGGVQQAWLVAPVEAAARLNGLDALDALMIAPLAAALANLGRVGVAGARVGVLGQGMLGQMVARAARWHGAAQVIVADASDLRLARAVADRAVRLPSLSASVTDAPDIDLLVDTTGDVAPVRWWATGLRPGGTLFLLGWYPRLELAFLQGLSGERRVLLAAEPDGAAIVAARDAIAIGAIAAAGLTTHRFGRDRAAQAYAVALGDPDALQVVLAWD